METAIVVVVPEAEAVLGAWRRRHTYDGALGAPAHVTLLYPWVDAGRVRDEDVALVRETVAPFRPFECVFREPGRFEGDRTVLYLRPEPSEPFVEMTAAIVAAFPEHPPYRGVHAEVIPHLTVTDTGEQAAAAVGGKVPRLLPLRTEVSETWILRRATQGWEPWHRCPFRP